jgi:2-C-methyl-D-erythritol 4-phosphate cytidylyltransferase
MPEPPANTPEAAPTCFAVVIPAAGTGNRMGGRKKPLLELLGRPVLDHAIEALQAAPGCGEVVPVLHADEHADAALADRLAAEFGLARLARGGPTRQASVLAGLELLGEEVQIVLIHDAVRPLIDPGVVQRVAETAARFGGACAAVPASDTVKQVGQGRRIEGTPPRERLWFARTPQGFRRELILRAHYAARDQGFCGTDDAQLVERLGHEVRVVEDTCDNLKITTAEDLAIAEAILRWRRAGHSQS